MICISDFKSSQGNVMSRKPMQINPLKLSQPMGALLCFLGIKDTMPLMHGAQGCASFSKVFFTRHFSDPIAIQTTAVNDITAVIDGGEYSIGEAIKNITAKVKPSLVGLFTTGMTETKGDDIKGVTYLLRDEQRIVYVHTPDFEGGLESGFARSVEAIIEQLVVPSEEIDLAKATLIPHASMTPLEVERVKEEIAKFGFEVYALPDLSLSLDGHLGLKQGTLTSGGISVDDIAGLASSSIVITVGGSVKRSGELLASKNPAMQHLHLDSLGGLVNNDAFYKGLLQFRSLDKPTPSVVRWRKRLQDALLDTHFALGGARVILALEPDELLSVAETITEAGATIVAALSPTKSPVLEKVRCEHLVIGDFDDIMGYLPGTDMIIGNFHAQRIAHEHHKAVIVRGFPNYEIVGNQLKSDLLYEGSCALLFEVANTMNHYREMNAH